MTPADTMRDGNLTPAGDKVDKVAQDDRDEGYAREALASAYERAQRPESADRIRNAWPYALKPDEIVALDAIRALADRQPDQQFAQNAKCQPDHVSDAEGGEVRETLRKVFDQPGLLNWMAKAIRQGAMPMDQSGKFIAWSDWLADKLDAAAPRPAEQGEGDR